MVCSDFQASEPCNRMQMSWVTELVNNTVFKKTTTKKDHMGNDFLHLCLLNKLYWQKYLPFKVLSILLLVPMYPSRSPLPVSLVVKCCVVTSLMHRDWAVKKASSVPTSATLTTDPASDRRWKLPAGLKSTNHYLYHFLPSSVSISDNCSLPLLPSGDANVTIPLWGNVQCGCDILLLSTLITKGGCGMGDCLLPCCSMPDSPEGHWRCLANRETVPC